MIVDTYKLNSWTPEGFALNEEAEIRITQMVFNSPIAKVTQGYSPEYDVMLEDGTKIEIKFTSKNTIYIEDQRADGRPSGLSLSEADYYLIVLTGYRNGYGTIGKVKVIPTDVLREVSKKCKRKEYLHEGKGSSKGFILDRELGNNDGWVGNLNVTDEGFDLSGWQKGKYVKTI